MKSDQMYPKTTKESLKRELHLHPEIMESLQNFSKAVFKEGALSEKTKQLIAVAVAHVTQCP